MVPKTIVLSITPHGQGDSPKVICKGDEMTRGAQFPLGIEPRLQPSQGRVRPSHCGNKERIARFRSEVLQVMSLARFHCATMRRMNAVVDEAPPLHVDRG